jgi:hypothetical protein
MVVVTFKFYESSNSLISETKLPALKSGIQRPNSTHIGKDKNRKRNSFWYSSKRIELTYLYRINHHRSTL